MNCELLDDALTAPNEPPTFVPDVKPLKQEKSLDDLLSLTSDECDELHDFLKDVETPVLAPAPATSPESFKCWGITVFSVTEEQQVDPIGTPFTLYPVRGQTIFNMPPTRPALVTSPTKRKVYQKNRTIRQLVPFEEMVRLMSEYGPIVSPRNRKIKDSNESGRGGAAKVASIKRKFYRWFPDFEDRFVNNPDGLDYMPKAGHENEKAYRAAMRNMDQAVLNHKRKVGRDNKARLEFGLNEMGE